MDEQERPVTEAAKDSEPGAPDRALMVIGIIFLVVGAVMFLGPGDGGVAFLLIGLLFLVIGRARRRR